jgi:choline kinase
MTIVIPMAGASARFTNVGMSPKYLLKIKPFITLFDMSVYSFKKWFDTAKFIIIVKDEYAAEFAESHLKLLKIKNYKVINLDFLTRGQAESVYLGLKKAEIEDDGDELMIFNIDTIRTNLEIPNNIEWDTLFDVFYDSSPSNKWSFAKTDDNYNILKTAEKKIISNWCSTGLYIFRSIWLYTDAYEQASKDKEYNFYIAPLYNYLKGLNNKILICPNENVDFAGIPEQYNNVVEKYKNIDVELF